jgi:hypothetical protein
MTPYNFLRIYISLLIGIICTTSVSLFLLAWIINSSNISVDSLHHDFQTILVITADQWSHNPELRTAIDLRWLLLSSSIALMVGLFPNDRANRLLRWLASIKMYVRTRFSAHPSRIALILTDHDSAPHRSISNVICHGSLPVYISQSSISLHSEAPAIPSLVRQSTLAPTFCSRASPVEHQQPEPLPQTSERDTRSSLSQPCDSETIRPKAASEPKETSQPYDASEPSRSSQQTERVPASMLALAGCTCPPSSFEGASSAHRTCEEALTTP